MSFAQFSNEFSAIASAPAAGVLCWRANDQRENAHTKASIAPATATAVGFEAMASTPVLTQPLAASAPR
jgi:hypothetical protein